MTHITSKPICNKKYHCRKCGERLIQYPVTRTLPPGAPDRQKFLKRGTAIGNITVTEYILKCPSCDETFSLEAQRIIHEIQSVLGKHVISDEEFRDNRLIALQRIEKKSDIRDGIFFIIIMILLIVMISAYLKL